MEKVFLDCGIIKNIIHTNNPEKTQAFYSSLFQAKIIEEQHPFFIFSPFLMLELVGIKLKDLIPPARLNSEFSALLNQKNYTDKSLLLADFLTRLKNIFKDEQLLTKTSLKLKIKNELKFRDDWGKGILIHIFLNGISKRSARGLHESLIIEMIQALDYKNLLTEEDLIEFEIHQFRTYVEAHLLHQMNLPFLRLVCNMYSKTKPDGKKLLRHFDEIGDCEIVHFSLLGHCSENIFTSVKIFTTENLETWKDRIKLVLAFINFINDTVIPQNNRVNPHKILQPMAIQPGIIFRVNQHTGLVEREGLDVQSFIASL